MNRKINIENYLKNCGFKKKRDGFMQLDIKHKFIRKCHITYDYYTRNLTVWGYDIEDKNAYMIYRCKYSPDKLNEIYNWLTMNDKKVFEVKNK